VQQALTDGNFVLANILQKDLDVVKVTRKCTIRPLPKSPCRTPCPLEGSHPPTAHPHSKAPIRAPSHDSLCPHADWTPFPPSDQPDPPCPPLPLRPTWAFPSSLPGR
jgi:hypothetical protein